MVHGAVSVFLRLLGGVAFLLLIGAGLLVWRLGQGPLPLASVTPYVEEVLSAQADEFAVQVGDAYLYWESAGRELDLRVSDAVAVAPNGEVLAAVPELSVTLDPLALLRGQVRLRSVEVLEPHIRLVRDQQGRVSLGMWYPGSPAAPDVTADAAETVSSDAVFKAMIGALLGGDDPRGGVTAVRIVKATATVRDHRIGVVWRLPSADVEMYRGDDGTLGVAAGLDLQVRGGTAHFDAVGGYEPRGGILDADLTFAGVNPATLSTLSESLAPLAALDLPLAGRARVAFTVTGALMPRRIAVDLRGGQGTLRLPAPLATDYPVEALAVTASARQAGEHLTLDQLRVELADGALVEASGTVTRGAGAAEDAPPYGGTIAVRVANLEVDALDRYWPAGVAVNPRGWITENLHGGRLIEGNWRFTLAGPAPEALDVAGLEGVAEVDGVEVHYLRPMPPLQDVAARLTFEGLSAIDIRSRRGGVYGLSLADATVRLVGLDKGQEVAEIDLTVAGPVADALKLIDHEPLGYPSRLGLEQEGAGGQVVTGLKMRVPLLNDLRLEDLHVQADANITDLTLRQAVKGRDLTKGNLTVAVTTEYLEAQGQAFVGDIPAGFTWRENFAGQPFRTRYRVRTVLNDSQRRSFGLDVAPFIPPYMAGPARAELELTYFDDERTTLGAQIDLRDAALALPWAGWSKASGAPGQASVSARLDEEGLRDVPRFTVTADGLEVGGSVALTEAGGLQRLELARLAVGDSRLSGVLARDGTGFRAEIEGAYLDARPFLEAEDGEADADAADGTEPAEALPPLVVEAKLDTVRLADAGVIDTVRGRIERGDGQWRAIRLQGTPEGGQPFIFVLGREAQSQRRTFIARTDDAGSLLRATGLIDTVRGGRLQADGTVTPDGVAEGMLVITDYRVVDAPLLARILSVAALTGIVDALTGEGLAFDRLDAPFRLNGSQLTLTDFRTHGSSLGLTADGTVDIDRRVVDLRGTVVPVYVLNSLLGKIPLLGGLLTGFEEGGGMFAADYAVQGPVAAPDISVNPLSALAPGVLRNLFGFMMPSAQEAPEQDPPQEPAAQPSSPD